MIAALELRRMADAKLADASVLYDNGKYDNALYLCGYAIELGLKAQICDTLGWDEFPSETKDFQGLQSFQTHDLNRLLHLSGKEKQVKQDIPGAWTTVSSWKSEWRYLQFESTSRVRCREMLDAVAIVKEAL